MASDVNFKCIFVRKRGSFLYAVRILRAFAIAAMMAIFERCSYRGLEGQTSGKVGSPFYTASLFGFW